MLGVPRKDRQQFMKWSNALNAYMGTGQPQLDVARHAAHDARELTAYFKILAHKRRVEPREDLISSLVELEEEGERLSEHELLSMCGFLIVAGHETTMALLGNGMLALLRHSDRLERIRDDLMLVDRAVEELLRYDSPIQHQTRVAAEDFELRDRQIHKGQRVLPFLGAANRDLVTRHVKTANSS